MSFFGGRRDSGGSLGINLCRGERRERGAAQAVQRKRMMICEVSMRRNMVRGYTVL